MVKDQTNAIAAKARQVYCNTLGMTFPSIATAAKKLNLKDTSIIRVCQGKQEKTKGFRFEYVNK